MMMSQVSREVIPDDELDEVIKEAKEDLSGRLPDGFGVEAARYSEAGCPEVCLDIVRM
jgi:hypothetical protein